MQILKYVFAGVAILISDITRGNLNSITTLHTLIRGIYMKRMANEYNILQGYSQRSQNAGFL